MTKKHFTILISFEKYISNHVLKKKLKKNELGYIPRKGLYRKFIESTVQFFLIFYSIVIAGTLNAKTQFYLTIVLFIGLIICVMLGATIIRAQKKLDLILEDLFADPDNPIALVTNKAKKKFSVGKVIGYIIPIFCTGTLLLAFIFSLTGGLKPQ